MTGNPRSRPPLTIGALLSRDQGLNLHCQCGHRTALLPVQVAAMGHPETRLLALKRKFRCTMCGRSGADEAIRMETFDVVTPFIDDGGAYISRTTRSPHH